MTMDPVTSSPASNRFETTSEADGEAFPLRAFFGHHKCATSWIDLILTEICFHLGREFQIVHRPVRFEEHGSLSAFVRDRDVDFLAYTNADRQHTDALALYRGFHVVRDPRDILVSAYFSHLNSHPTSNWPELIPHRRRLQGLSKDEGLLCEMEFSRGEFEQMYAWDYEQENVLELKMENLTQNPQEGFLQIVRFLDLLDEEECSPLQRVLRTLTLKMNRLNRRGRRYAPGDLPLFPVPRRPVSDLPAERLRTIVERKSFSNLAGGRRKGQENVDSHFRKGVPGDWKNHLKEEHIRHFKDNYNDLLIKLGYETDGDW